MRTLLILLTFIGCTQKSISQEFAELKTVLKKELTQKSNKDGRWIYYENKSEIKKIENLEVKKYLPKFDFYKVRLTNYLGHHISDSDCLILFDQEDLKMVLIEPLWYSGISSNLLKMFVGLELTDKNSILLFVFGLQDIMLTGSTGTFENTKYEPTKITFDLTNTPHRKNSVWRHLEIEIKENKILSFKSTNPTTGDIVKIK